MLLGDPWDEKTLTIFQFTKGMGEQCDYLHRLNSTWRGIERSSPLSIFIAVKNWIQLFWYYFKSIFVMRHERMNKWMTRILPDSPIYSTKWASKTHDPQHIHFSKSETILRWMGKGPVGGNGLPVRLFKCPVAVGPDYIVRHVVLSRGTGRGMARFW